MNIPKSNKMLPKQKLIWLLLALVTAVSGKSKHIFEDEADKKFSYFLDDKMKKYGDWLQDNNEDPSSPISGILTLSSSRPVPLHCEVRDQIIRHHSNTIGDNLEAFGSLNEHDAFMMRDNYNAYEFAGKYNCSGVLYAQNFADLSDDLAFSGEGEFISKVNSSHELCVIRNIGITEDYRLDLSHTWNDYYFTLNFSSGPVQLTGDWNATEVLTYIDVVEKTFGDLYEWHLRYSGYRSLNPSYVLLARYQQEILTKANLTEIVGEENLPPPYIPTPPTTPTTSPTTTTVSATRGSTSTTPRSGVTRAYVNNGVVMAQIILATLLIFFISKI